MKTLLSILLSAGLMAAIPSQAAPVLPTTVHAPSPLAAAPHKAQPGKKGKKAHKLKKAKPAGAGR